jgi:hypothetical protein
MMDYAERLTFEYSIFGIGGTVDFAGCRRMTLPTIPRVFGQKRSLLTWNCRHMANATFADKIERACESHGCLSPRICTPEQLMEQP